MTRLCFCALMAMTWLLAACQQQPVAAVEPQQPALTTYLLVYFQDASHGLHFALSRDGYRFTALNDGKPVVEGYDIAEQHGIRDPHLLRGPDNQFYLAATDLHIFAQQQGYRQTQWQRPEQQYGWGNNRGFVLMKSADLIHWSQAQIRLDQAFEGFENIGAAWAPQTIYDPNSQQLMLYYTLRQGNGVNRLYYSYVNQDYNQLLSKPELLFSYPQPETTYIDADISKVGDQYRMFYVSHEGTPGIKMAVSDEINRGYRYQPEWIDQESVACEAPNLWRRLGTDTWVLMIDIYGKQPHNFTFLETQDFKHFKDIGEFNEGVMQAVNFRSPKHGTVVHLTQAEADALAHHWGLLSY